MNTVSTRRRITEVVTSWPGVETGFGERGEFSFRYRGREIGHLHGDHVAHFTFPKDVGAELRSQGRVGPLAAKRIRDEAELVDVVELMRSNYDRLVARLGEADGVGVRIAD
jgi:hypothetical protein